MTNMHPARPDRRLARIEIGDRSARSSYAHLLAAAEHTGRCPVWISGYGVESIDVRWDAGQALARLALRDPAEVLADRWPGGCPVDDCLAPFGDAFPGLLARAPVERAAAVGAAIAYGIDGMPGDLAVVSATRPADVPAATGWTGAFAYWDDVVGLSAVLRSWEDRFGAVLVRMERTALWFSVAAPPSSEQDCLRVAAEHVACCWDAAEAHTLRGYALRLRGAPVWRLVWE